MIVDTHTHLWSSEHLRPPFIDEVRGVGGSRVDLTSDPEAHSAGTQAADMVFVDSSHEDQFARFNAEDTVQHVADEGGSEIDFRPVIDELHRAASDSS